MLSMKPRGRVLHFAVTGVLLGGGTVASGCASKVDDAYSNTGPMSPPQEELHVNPGPDEDPAGAAEGGAAEGDGAAAEGGGAAADGGAAAEGGASDPKEIVDVNPGPQEPPAEPPPELVEEPSTNNVRKVEEPKRKRQP
jgi:hypothetical protein